MKILTVLTYYRPHTSGLTIYAERLAEAFAKRGHEVTVLTSHFDPSTPAEEIVNGVRVVRVPVWFRVSKGVIMPTFGFLAWKYVKECDVLHLHLPQFDAPGFAIRAKLLGKKSVITYHCDLKLPDGGFNNIVNKVVDIQNWLAATFIDRIVTYTQDYADHSPFLTLFKNKITPILPPVVLPPVDAMTMAEYRKKKSGHVIGMATRFASEKGVEILLSALPQVLKAYSDAKVFFAGQYQNVMGEQAYFDRLKPEIEKLQQEGRWEFFGTLNPAQMNAYYRQLDVLVVPSLNSTEAFGLVQIEAMMNSVPCIASALPGVRQPVNMHKMGLVTPIGDAGELANAIIKIFSSPNDYQGRPEEITKTYEPNTVAERFEQLFRSIK